jgi:predicted helicase
MVAISEMLCFYETKLKNLKSLPRKITHEEIHRHVDGDRDKIAWSAGLLSALQRFDKIPFDEHAMVSVSYRPFFKQLMYNGPKLIERRGQFPKILPESNLSNLLICISGIGGNKDFSCLMTNTIADVQILFNCQCFPLYYYEKRDAGTPTLFDRLDDEEYIRHDGIKDYIHDEARKVYGETVTKEDIFYYVYGFLHSPEYRETFANDLKKSLPRLPLVDDSDQFWAFSKAGRQLGDLHVNYESVPPYPSVTVTGAESGNYRVEKMRFPSKGKKDTIHMNSLITVSDIPSKAYEYVVNGKSAIEWIMDRYQVTTHKESGITNDPNDWAAEVGNPRYIFDLLLSIINVSVQTVDIVASLPKVKFD